MNYMYPSEAVWWQALCFRLSGPENAPVRRLMAGSPELPREGFLALLMDRDPDVLSALSENPSLPVDLALCLLRDPDAPAVLHETWYDRLVTRPELTADDLGLIMEGLSREGRERALLHPNADSMVMEEYFRCHGQVDNPTLASHLLRRFPWGEDPEVWSRIKEDDEWQRALLSCPDTPQPFLEWMAWEQRQQLAQGNGLHEITEEICCHPAADAEVFKILMGDDGFAAHDYEHGLRCLRLISTHPAASERQRAAALLLVETSEDWGPRQFDEDD